MTITIHGLEHGRGTCGFVACTTHRLKMRLGKVLSTLLFPYFYHAPLPMTSYTKLILTNVASEEHNCEGASVYLLFFFEGLAEDEDCSLLTCSIVPPILF